VELLVIILKQTEKLQDLLSALVELGIEEATILDGEEIGQYLAYEVPIFAGLRQLIGGGRKTQSKIIITLIKKDAELIGNLHQILVSVGIDFTRSETGRLFTLPINRAGFQ
jgi:hypothetical protein